MNKFTNFIFKNSNKILTSLSCAGFISTVVLAVKATPQAISLITFEKQTNGTGELTPIETIKIAWKPYIPAMLSGTATLACIMGLNYCNNKQQAALLSSYALLDKAYKDYKNKVKDEMPEYSERIEEKVIQSRFDDSMILDSNKRLYYDMLSMRYFQTTEEELLKAEHLIDEKLARTGMLLLNDVYDCLGIDRVPYGWSSGWLTDEFNEEGKLGKPIISFNTRTFIMDDGMECTILDIECPSDVVFNIN